MRHDLFADVLERFCVRFAQRLPLEDLREQRTLPAAGLFDRGPRGDRLPHRRNVRSQFRLCVGTLHRRRLRGERRRVHELLRGVRLSLVELRPRRNLQAGELRAGLSVQRALRVLDGLRVRSLHGIGHLRACRLFPELPEWQSMWGFGRLRLEELRLDKHPHVPRGDWLRRNERLHSGRTVRRAHGLRVAGVQLQ